MNRWIYRITPVVISMLALSISTGPALAATTWKVTPGGKATASSTNLGITNKSKARNGAPLPTVCNSKITASLKSGSGLSGNGIGTLKSVTFSECQYFTGALVMKSGHLPWRLNAKSYNSSNGTTSGTITGIHIAVTEGAGAPCSFVIDGTSAVGDNGRINFTYVNNTHKLTFPKSGGNLHYYKVNGCSSLAVSGDAANLHGTYAVSPAQKVTGS